MNALALLVATAVEAADAAPLTNAELNNATAEWIDACAPSLTSESGEVTCPPVDRVACDAVEAKYGGSIGTWDVSEVTSIIDPYIGIYPCTHTHLYDIYIYSI